MSRSRTLSAVCLACLALAFVILPACSRRMTALMGPNERPQVEILDARAAGAAGVRVRWAGRDPDGRVANYRWMVAPLREGSRTIPEHVTQSTECLVTPTSPQAFGHDAAAREPDLFTLWAVDRGGAVSDPAQLAVFGGNNVAPTVTITGPQPSSLLNAQVPPNLCITWTGIDPDGVTTNKPVKYKFILLTDDSEFSRLTALVNPDSLRRFAVEHNWAGWDSTSSDTEFVHFTNLTQGQTYLFVVTGFDEVGDYDPIFSLNKNMLNFQVAFPNSLGPLFTLSGPAFQYQYNSGGWFDLPSRTAQVEVPSEELVKFNWSSQPVVGQVLMGYRWVLDPVSPLDQTPRSGPADLRHWSDWDVNLTSLTLGPFVQPGLKRGNHRLYIEGRSNPGSCVVPGSMSVSLAIIHFVTVPSTLGSDLLVVDDTRLEPDRIGTGGCPNSYTQRWPSAAELDTFLYARGNVPWRCTKNPTSGVNSVPGLLAGYAFDTLGTRGVLSGQTFDPNDPPGQGGLLQFQSIPLSVLAQYRHVIWLTDVTSAQYTNPITDSFNPMTAMRFMSLSPSANVLSTYVRMGGQVWIVGSGATASLLPFDRVNNNVGGILRFSSAPQFGEIRPGGIAYETMHLRSEISVVANATGATRSLGRFESAPGSLASLPATLDSRTTASDPLPPTRTVPSSFYYSTRAAEFLSQPNAIIEGAGSALDSLYVVQGGSVPAGGNAVAMTVYHGADNGVCVWTGFDLWSFQRSEVIPLVDWVLQSLWGLPRAPVVRGAEPGVGGLASGNPGAFWHRPQLLRAARRP